MTAGAEQRAHASAYLKKAEEYLAAAEDSLTAGRNTPAAGNAVHAGISAKDAIVTMLTGTTRKSKAHAAAAKELQTALGHRESASTAERALRELVSAKADVEYGTSLVTLKKATTLVRRSTTLVDLAVRVVRLGQ